MLFRSVRNMRQKTAVPEQLRCAVYQVQSDTGREVNGMSYVEMAMDTLRRIKNAGANCAQVDAVFETVTDLPATCGKIELLRSVDTKASLSMKAYAGLKPATKVVTSTSAKDIDRAVRGLMDSCAASPEDETPCINPGKDKKHFERGDKSPDVERMIEAVNALFDDVAAIGRAHV